MEAELKPQVVETFDRIAEAYGKMRKLQDKHAADRSKPVTGAETKKVDTFRGQVIADVKSLSLNASRIESLVEQLYDINKRLVRLEGRLLRLAESYGIKREDFLEAYYTHELDEEWSKAVATRGKAGRNSSGARATPWEKSVVKSTRSRPKPGSTSPNTAASSTRCRRASARPPSPRRRWSKRTFGW